MMHDGTQLHVLDQSADVPCNIALATATTLHWGLSTAGNGTQLNADAVILPAGNCLGWIRV